MGAEGRGNEKEEEYGRSAVSQSCFGAYSTLVKPLLVICRQLHTGKGRKNRGVMELPFHRSMQGGDGGGRGACVEESH